MRILLWVILIAWFITMMIVTIGLRNLIIAVIVILILGNIKGGGSETQLGMDLYSDRQP